MSYFLLIDGAEQGPFSADQLKHMWRTGQVTQDTNVWYEGLSEWLPFSAIEDEIFPPVQVKQYAPAPKSKTAEKSEKSEVGQIVWMLRALMFAIVCFILAGMVRSCDAM